MLLGELPQHLKACALDISAKRLKFSSLISNELETGSVKATRSDRCKRRIYLGRCGTEFKTTGETNLTRAADHGISTPEITKNPQIN